MSDLFAPACSITPTQRRRFFWAAWWTGAPVREPFRKPDASSGGARTLEEAHRAAERAAGRVLVEIDPRWARAWARVIAGEPAWTRSEPDPSSARPERAPPPASMWTTLGISRDATLAEIRRAYRARALELHPDHGGDPEIFRQLHKAYKKALESRRHKTKR